MFFRIPAENTCSRLKMKKQKQKNKKIADAMNLLKAGNKDVRIKHVVLSKTLFNNDKYV